MAVCTNKRVRVCNRNAVLIFVSPDSLRKILKVYLMADTCAGGHNAEVIKRFLTPFQEGIALHVALVFTVHVHLERAWVAEFINHHRVVDDQINRVQGVDFVRVATKRHDAVAHRCKVNNGRNACEILH